MQAPTTDTLTFIREHRNDDVRKLALGRIPAGVDAQWALQQIEGLQTAARKLPTWVATDGIWWPQRLSLEQCSSEVTALYKRRLALSLLPQAEERGVLTDLTGGLGVDFTILAPLFRQATHVERNEMLSAIVGHNLEAMGLHHARVRCDDAMKVAEEPGKTDLLLLDPARRDCTGRKVAGIEDCQPDVTQLLPLLAGRIHWVLLKLSPMLDITAALRSLPMTTEVHVVSVDGECKELLLVLQGDDTHTAGVSPRIHAALLKSGPTSCPSLLEAPGVAAHRVAGMGTEEAATTDSIVFQPEEERQATPAYASRIGAWLFEPDAAVLKAGALKILCARYGVEKVAPMSHLYTADRPVAQWPGRSYKVEGVYSFNRQELRLLMAETPRAELSVRGFPQSVSQLRHQLKLKEGGNTHLFATTLADGRKVIIKTERE